jgi:hypothetical protein
MTPPQLYNLKLQIESAPDPVAEQAFAFYRRGRCLGEASPSTLP